MKRHANAKTPEELQREKEKEKDKENPASPSPPSQSNSSQSSPESTQPSNYAILYVDVVKNMTKLVISQPPPPPPCPPPEFSIFREDFPALPGTRLSSASSSVVPDDWTAMLSDDDDADAVGDGGTAGSLGELAASGPPSSASTEEDDFKKEEQQQQQQKPPVKAQTAGTSGSQDALASAFNCEFLPQLFGYLSNPARFNVSLIFGKQFLHEGIRQRAQARALRRQIPPPRLQAPPGFENVHRYARLNATGCGMPVGGVYFEPTPPGGEKTSKTDDANVVDGCFGMLGLARNLGLVQRNPQLKPHFFGEESHKETEFFGKTLPDPSSNPEESEFKVPKNYVIAGKIKLQQPKMEQMEVELLFYFFYTYTGDMMQLLAAAELAERGWRFHKLEHLWILRQADNPNYMYRGFQESGEYNYFNMFQWRILPRYFQLEPEHLERTVSKDELYELHGYHPQMAR